MLDSDPGARYLGEFAIGTNYQHRPLHQQHPAGRKDRRQLPHGRGRRLPRDRQPEQEHDPLGHDLRHATGFEILVDGEVIYRNGDSSSKPPARDGSSRLGPPRRRRANGLRTRCMPSSAPWRWAWMPWNWTSTSPLTACWSCATTRWSRRPPTGAGRIRDLTLAQIKSPGRRVHLDGRRRAHLPLPRPGDHHPHPGRSLSGLPQYAGEHRYQARRPRRSAGFMPATARA